MGGGKQRFTFAGRIHFSSRDDQATGRHEQSNGARTTAFPLERYLSLDLSYASRKFTRVCDANATTTARACTKRVLYQSDIRGQGRRKGRKGGWLVPFGKWTFVICRGVGYKRVD